MEKVSRLTKTNRIKQTQLPIIFGPLDAASTAIETITLNTSNTLPELSPLHNVLQV